MIDHNWDYIDRLLEEPRAALAEKIRETCPLILSPNFYMNRVAECQQFHKDLVERWQYEKPSDRLYTTLTEWIYEREREMNRELGKDMDWGYAGTMETIMPQGMDFEHAHFHEIVFYAFTQDLICGDWLDNLNEHLGGEQVKKMFQMCQGLFLVAPPVFDHAVNEMMPQTRKLSHSDICILLKIIDVDDWRMAMLGFDPKADSE